MTQINWTKIEPPQLEFRDDRVQALEFSDSYFQPSKASGNAGRVQDEIRYTFFDGNDLERRWSDANHAQFCIAELGLGSGANLCETLRLWQRSTNRPARLDYLSFEARPFGVDDITQASRAQGIDLTALIDAVGADPFYPLPGITRHQLAPGFWITMVLGDAQDTLGWFKDQLVDAWFLDGFAPARNQALWSDQTLSAVYRLTRPGGTFATFTAASAVNRTLTARGFCVRKTKGFGPKRERLVGQKPGARPPSAGVTNVTIAGAGIMGCWAAYYARQAGLKVVQFDPRGPLNGPGSGVPVPVIDWRPTLDFTAIGRMMLTSFLAASRAYRTHFPTACHPGPVTSLQRRIWPAFAHWGLPEPPEPREPREPSLAQDQDSWQTADPLYALGGTITLDRQRLDFGGDVARRRQTFDIAHHDGSALLLATGPQANDSRATPTTTIRGQQSLFDANAPQRIPASPLNVGKLGGLAPNSRLFFLGSSFERDHAAQWWLANDNDDTAALAQFAAHAALPDIDPKPTTQWAGLRAASIDRLPNYIVGQDQISTINCLGSHGFTFAPLLAQQWVSDLVGAPNVIDVQILARIGRAGQLSGYL